VKMLRARTAADQRARRSRTIIMAAILGVPDLCRQWQKCRGALNCCHARGRVRP
jgi:hypothetical protein